jgi:signal transduction histidine kinase
MSPTKPLILIIDDTPGNLMLLGSALESEFDLRIATFGEAGLQLAAEMQPALILLDVMMPGMDGFEVCRRLKADPLLAAIPVMFVTAMTESGAETSGLALGAADYLAKPINIGIARQRIRNLVERERLRKQVEAVALEAAERLTTLKRNFLRNVSHELRTPLSGILGLAQMGQRARDLDKAHTTCGNIHATGQQLLELVENVLDFADAEAGLLAIVPVPFVVSAVLDDLDATWRPRAGAKGLELRVEGGDALSAPCIGDARRVAQVLGQLLGNAVKFTADGQVTLRAERTGDRVRFTIADSGIGMTDTELHAAFHPFEQADGSLTRRFGGIGLGLALVRQLVERMGGTLHAESVAGAGTRFEVNLPLPAVAA